VPAPEPLPRTPEEPAPDDGDPAPPAAHWSAGIPGANADPTPSAEPWRTLALDGWADAAALALTAAPDGPEARVAALEAELAAMRATVSWRVTRPLRAVRRLRAARPTSP